VETEKERAALSKKPASQRSKRDAELLGLYTRISASGHNFLGLIAARHESFSEAAKQFASTRALQPDFPDVDFNLGLALFASRRFFDAAAPLDRALSRDPFNPRIKKYVGLTRVETGKYEEAVKLLEEIRASQSDDPRVLLAWERLLPVSIGLTNLVRLLKNCSSRNQKRRSLT